MKAFRKVQTTTLEKTKIKKQTHKKDCAIENFILRFYK